MTNAPRKTLGNPTGPGMTSLARLMEAQPTRALASWCVGYAAGHYLPIYEQEAAAAGIDPETAGRMEHILMVVDGYIEGMLSDEQAKTAIAAARSVAQETFFSPAAQAAAHACSAAASVVFLPTSALGMASYGAAAVAYATEGLKQTAARYDELAEEEFARMLESLAEDAAEKHV